MRPWMALLMLLPACGGGGGGDGGMPPTLDARMEYGSFIKVNLKDPSAVLKMPSMPLPIDAPIDTDSSTLCSTNHEQTADFCLIAGTTITLPQGGTFRARGSRPLVVLATTLFDLEGVLDVSSKHGEAPGAGALPASGCPGTVAATGNSGGFGGSFTGKGGDGGAVDGNQGTAAAALATPPTKLRGGCPGGSGNTATVGSAGGAGGAGGGAVAIIAGKITVNGKINASGAGGSGGPAVKSGGGGGGSGGMVVLDVASPSDITVGAGPDIWLYANGGGGGQGGTGGTVAGSGAGDDGVDSTNPAIQALGGRNLNRDGGRGGAGSAGTARRDGEPAFNPANNGGGGAGGGGAGFIHAPSMQGALVTPPATYP